MCILYLSKVLMYIFPYHYIKNKNHNNAKLSFTDIDSLMYEIKTEDVYEDFRKDKEMLDFRNYSPKLKYYNESNKLVACKMKNEGVAGGVAVKEFVRF